MHGQCTLRGPRREGMLQTFYLRSSSGQAKLSKLFQAARDGLLDVVEGHLRAQTARLHDVDDDGYTALHHAARYNRVNVLKCLVEAGAEIGQKGGVDEVQALHMASRYNSINTVQFLLGQGAEVNAKDIKGRTPLHYATRRGHDTVTKMLLSVTSCAVNAADTDLTTPMHMAAIQGNTGLIELLISRGANVGMRDINEMTALMWAATEGHCEVIKLLLKMAQKHMVDDRAYIRGSDNEGNTALHLAVQNGKLEVAQILLDHYADVNGQKNNLATPLHIAATHGFVDITELLIVNGADVNRADADQMTPVHKAALYNRVDIIKLLIKNGADLNAKDKKNKSPLHCACWKGQTEAAQFLLDNGAQVAEADSGLMTALHWAVQFGHYNTLTVLLKQSSVGNLLEATDKNDQTVLHYAAQSGNVLVLKTLLDYGAKTDAKDQEERTPLHCAAQADNVHCVETLIQASRHETNDDDVDGHTPLLLAAMHGNHLVVQVLLSLGAEVSSRDDEHRTVLMLSAAEGHTMVMKILLDNHAAVNEVDKLKNTALHYACAGGYVEAVHMLLEKKADVRVKNTHDQAPLDLAIDNMQNDVAVTMLKHKSWRQCMNVRDAKGHTPMDRLIARLPDAAQVVLDHCVERSSRDDEDANLTMSFDYFFIDPGPDDEASKSRRYFALNTMVRYGRDTLLSHPLCQNIMSQKWVGYGRRMFSFNSVAYFGFVTCLTWYTFLVAVTIEKDTLHDMKKFCPIFIDKLKLPRFSTNFSRVSLLAHYIQNGVPEESLRITDHLTNTISGLLGVFIFLFMCREVFKFFMQGWKYFFNPYSWIACILVGTTYAFIHPPGYFPCLIQWRAGWIAHFLAWINFIMYLRKIDFVGIYVIMFVAVLASLLKVVLVYFFFCWAFAGSFYILMSRRHDAFDSIGTSVVNILVMTLGEIEFMDNFVSLNLKPFEVDVYILLVIFLFLMPIVLMNLMIGVAVGDIEKIQRNAYLKRIALQVELLYNIENIMPHYFQRKIYTRRAIVKPNEGSSSCWRKFTRNFIGSSRSLNFIGVEQKDKIVDTIEQMDKEIHQQANRLKTLQISLQQQNTLLEQIGARLNIDSGLTGADSVSVLLNADLTSYYDNVVVFPPTPTSPKPGHKDGPGLKVAGEKPKKEGPASKGEKAHKSRAAKDKDHAGKHKHRNKDDAYSESEYPREDKKKTDRKYNTEESAKEDEELKKDDVDTIEEVSEEEAEVIVVPRRNLKQDRLNFFNS